MRHCRHDQPETVNQRIYDALLLLQHRGQDAAGIGTLDGLTFHMHKAMGLVRDVFRTRNMRDLTGCVGIGHVRYPTQGCASSNEESQPFYVNAPYGILFAHNGNLTNAQEVAAELYNQDRRHINTSSDSEVLLNVLADELMKIVPPSGYFTAEVAFEAVKGVHKRVKGAYAVVALIAGKGLLAFRDPNGIRPLCFGTQKQADGTTDYLVSSESVWNTTSFAILLRVKLSSSRRTANSLAASALKIRSSIPAPLNTSTLLVPTASSTASASTAPVCVWANTLPMKWQNTSICATLTS